MHGGNDALLGHGLLRLGLHACRLVVGLCLGLGGLLVEQARLQVGASRGEVGLGRGQGRLGREQLVIDFGIAQFEDDRIRLDGGARLDQDALDPGRGFRGDPANLLRHERARAADLAQQLAALDGVDQHAAALDRWHGRTECHQTGSCGQHE